MIQVLEAEELQLQKTLEDAIHAGKVRYALLDSCTQSSYILNTSFSMYAACKQVGASISRYCWKLWHAIGAHMRSNAFALPAEL